MLSINISRKVYELRRRAREKILKAELDAKLTTKIKNKMQLELSAAQQCESINVLTIILRFSVVLHAFADKHELTGPKITASVRNQISSLPRTLRSINAGRLFTRGVRLLRVLTRESPIERAKQASVHNPRCVTSLTCRLHSYAKI